MMKPVIFITTFSETGYQLYGKSWIDSFIKCTSAYSNIRATLYVDDVVPNLPSNITQVIYDNAIPNHKQWMQEFDSLYDNKNLYGKVMGKRFSYKSFVMMHALNNNPNSFVVWLDGDCIFKDADYSSFPLDVLGSNSIACQREHNGGSDHIESGIIVFDTSSDVVQKFNGGFEKNYLINNILKMKAPYDGFIIFKTLNELGIVYNDLNKNYGKDGIQSDPSSTFLNPLIGNRFHHNIGYTGKSNYAEWDKVKNADAYFRLVKSSAPKKTAEEIQNIKKQLFQRRNGTSIK